MSERKILQKIRPILIEKSLIILPTNILEHTKQGSTTMISMMYTIIDVEDGEKQNVVSVGQGYSGGDKGSGAAFTYSLKYLIMKILMLETGDDPDKVSDEKIMEKKKESEELMLKLKSEVLMLQKGEKITADQGRMSIKYLEENKNNLRELKNIEKTLKDMRG